MMHQIPLLKMLATVGATHYWPPAPELHLTVQALIGAEATITEPVQHLQRHMPVIDAG